MSNYILSLSLLFLVFFQGGNNPSSLYPISGISLANGENLSQEDTKSLRLTMPLLFENGRFCFLLPKHGTPDTLRCAGFLRGSFDEEVDKLCLVTGRVNKEEKTIEDTFLEVLKIVPKCRVVTQKTSAGGRSQFYSIRFRFLRGNRCLADVNQSFLFSRANWLKRIGISFVTDSDGNRTMILPHFRSRTFGLHEPESEIDETVPEMYSQEVQSSGALSSHQQQPIYQPQETRGGASSSSWQPMHQEQTTYQPEIQPSQWLQPLYANQDPQQILPMGVQIGVPMTFPGFMALLVPVPAQMVYTTQQQQFPEPGLTLVPTQARGNDDYFEEQDF